MQVRDKIQSLALWGFVLALTGLTGMTDPATAAQSLQLAAAPADHAGNSANCRNCHFNPIQPKLNWKRQFTGNHANFTAREAGQEHMCGKCHTGAIRASHPTGFIPRRSLPSQYPLNARGEMTCTTCHALEEDGKIRSEANQSNRQFCESCHSASFFARMADAGTSILASGHLSVDKKSSGPVDKYSMQCMTCHMDNASISGTRTASIGTFMPGGGAKNHSIGSTYRNVSMRRDYNPESALAPEILLPEGKVSCLSCHKAYTAKHGKLVLAGNTCLQCHR